MCVVNICHVLLIKDEINQIRKPSKSAFVTPLLQEKDVYIYKLSLLLNRCIVHCSQRILFYCILLLFEEEFRKKFPKNPKKEKSKYLFVRH